MTEITVRGIYKHYKGNFYIVIGSAIHTETEEELVVYRALKDKNEIWVRPIKMFTDTVMVDNVPTPRFTYARQAI